jgi:hypothetical protein
MHESQNSRARGDAHCYTNSKHIPAAPDMYTTIEEPLEVVFSIQSMPRL